MRQVPRSFFCAEMDTDGHTYACSLQATWIRNTILRAVRETSPDMTAHLPMNLVFKAPSINALSNTVYRIMHGQTKPTTKAVTPQDLIDMAAKYSGNLPARPTELRRRQQTQDTIVITGTTGGFGCDILEHLLLDEGVEMVYAFNRLNSRAMERQRASFRRRGLNETLLDFPKVRMVEAILDAPDFGLEADLLDKVRRPFEPRLWGSESLRCSMPSDQELRHPYHAQW